LLKAAYHLAAKARLASRQSQRSACSIAKPGDPRSARLMALLSMTGHWAARDRLLSKAKSHFPAVAQAVGFGLGRSKMLDLSMGID
jgi:hypothetical protein